MPRFATCEVAANDVEGDAARQCLEMQDAAAAAAAGRAALGLGSPLLGAFPATADPLSPGGTAALSWGWLGRPAPRPPARAWQREKVARVAFVSSLVMPGLGQMYNERELWAVVAAGFEFYFIGEWISEQRLTNRYRNIVNAADSTNTEAQVLFELHRDNRIQAAWLLGITAILSSAQAFVDACLHDFDATPLPIQIGATPTGGARAALELRF